MQTGMVAVIRDRTKLRQAEQEVQILNERLRQQAEEKFRSADASFRHLITSSADGMVVVTKDGLIHFANPAAGTLFGRTLQEMAGDLFGFPLGEGVELELLRDNAEKAVVEMRIVETEWEGVPAYLATLRDITERKHGMMALQQSETRLRLLLEQLPCVSWTLDTKLRFTSFSVQGWWPSRMSLIGSWARTWQSTSKWMIWTSSHTWRIAGRCRAHLDLRTDLGWTHVPWPC